MDDGLPSPKLTVCKTNWTSEGFNKYPGKDIEADSEKNIEA